MDYRKFEFRTATEVMTTPNAFFVFSKSSIFRFKKNKNYVVFPIILVRARKEETFK